MWANSVWGLFTLAVGLWLAMIGLSPEWIWLQPWFRWTGVVCCVSSLTVLCWPLHVGENQAIVRAKIQHPARWLAELIEPHHVIIFGLVIALVGSVWLWRAAPSDDARVKRLENELATIKNERDARPNSTDYQAIKNRVSQLEGDINAANEQRGNAIRERDEARNRLASSTAMQSDVASPPVLPALLPKDKERMNEALAKIHGIIKTKLLGSIDQFHGSYGLQSFFLGGSPQDGYAGLLERMKQRSSEIQSDEEEIDAILTDKDYAYLHDDIRQIVAPSGYYVPGAENNLDSYIRRFLSTLDVLSRRFPKPDPEINSILATQSNELEPRIKEYTAWAKETVSKIEAKQKKLRER